MEIAFLIHCCVLGFDVAVNDIVFMEVLDAKKKTADVESSGSAGACAYVV
jgi:hypothetical protein